MGSLCWFSSLTRSISLEHTTACHDSDRPHIRALMPPTQNRINRSIDSDRFGRCAVQDITIWGRARIRDKPVTVADHRQSHATSPFKRCGGSSLLLPALWAPRFSSLPPRPISVQRKLRRGGVTTGAAADFIYVAKCMDGTDSNRKASLDTPCMARCCRSGRCSPVADTHASDGATPRTGFFSP